MLWEHETGGSSPSIPTGESCGSVRDTNQVGAATEGKVLAALIGSGHTVAVPFGVARYDLVLETPVGFKRVQCKTGRLRNGVVKFNVYSIDHGAKARRTYNGDADLFGVYCPDIDKVYLVPVGPQKAECYLRITPTKSGQNKGVLWAKDYEL